jgi:hypothetical protein
MMYWKGYGRKWLCPILRSYPSVCLEQLRNTMKTFGQDIQPPGPDFNLRPECEAGVRTSLPQRLVK